MTKLLQDLPAARKASAEAQAKVKAENAKHTPGPWKALGLLMGFGYVIKYHNTDGVESIAYIQAYDIDDDTPEPYGKWSDVSKANHDLVLAAPELLDALTGLLAVVNVRIDDPRTQQFDKARAAIAKAQGAPHE